MSEFIYDYASRRAFTREYDFGNGGWANPTIKRRIFDGLDVVQERDSNNQVTAQLVRDGNIGGILSRTTATDGAAFYGYDGNGNVTLLTNSAGQDVGHYRYDAFGNTLEAVGPRASENPYRFSTKELHAPSGLYDYGYRFYSPSMGRWMNRDPLQEEGGINLYGAMGNNLVNNVDEYGLTWLSNLFDEGGRWVNDQLFGKPKNYSSDEDGEVQRAVDTNAQVKKTGPKAAVVGMEFYMALMPMPGPKFTAPATGLSKVPGMAQGIQRKRKYIQVNVTRRGTKEGAKALFERINRRYGNQPLVLMRDYKTRRVIGLRNKSGTVFYRPKLGVNGQISNVEVIRSGRRIDIHIIK